MCERMKMIWLFAAFQVQSSCCMLIAPHCLYTLRMHCFGAKVFNAISRGKKMKTV